MQLRATLSRSAARLAAAGAAALAAAACADARGGPTAPGDARRPDTPAATASLLGPAPFEPVVTKPPVCVPDLVVTSLTRVDGGGALDLNTGSKAVRVIAAIKNQGLCEAGTFHIAAYGRTWDVDDVGIGFTPIHPPLPYPKKVDDYGNTLAPLAAGASISVQYKVYVSSLFLGRPWVQLSLYADDCGSASGPSYTTCAVDEADESNNNVPYVWIPLAPPTKF